MSQPPSSGPAPAASAEAPDQIPIAAPRSCSSNAAPMIANEQGMSSAAATPWMARAAISAAMSGAKPQAIEASVKLIMPIRKITRRPKRSAAAPPISSRADMHSV